MADMAEESDMKQEQRRDFIKSAIDLLGGPTKASNTLGVSNGTVHAWIKAGRISDIDKARMVADALDINVALLREKA